MTYPETITYLFIIMHVLYITVNVLCIIYIHNTCGACDDSSDLISNEANLNYIIMHTISWLQKVY